MLHFLLIPSTVEVQGIKFQESVPEIVRDGKAEGVFNCSHDDSSRPVMLWYQQRGGSGPLVLLGYNYGATTSNYEDGIKEQFEIKMEDRQRGSLVVREANVAHTAVYFCAAGEHSDVVWNRVRTESATLSIESMMNSIREERVCLSLQETKLFLKEGLCVCSENNLADRMSFAVVGVLLTLLRLLGTISLISLLSIKAIY